MADPFVGEIRQFGFNFAPRGWAVCEGQVIAISQNTALFSLLGVQYGGNGQSTFALPDLRGRVPIGKGQGPGLREYVIGQSGGTETVQLVLGEIPSHSHSLQVSSGAATSTKANSSVPATAFRKVYGGGSSKLATSSLATSGQGGSHNNRDPYLGVMYCIALQGIFPPRS
jgi:microcystin-dependent protein